MKTHEILKNNFNTNVFKSVTFQRKLNFGQSVEPHIVKIRQFVSNDKESKLELSRKCN